MKVFKFGGASVKDADGVRNMAAILSRFKDGPLAVVVSAMGKTTNSLEKVVNAYIRGNEWRPLLQEVISAHKKTLHELQPGENEAHSAIDKIESYCVQFLEHEAPADYDFTYDQIVATGELLSTKIIASYLLDQGLNIAWTDARKLIRTNNHYRDAAIDWQETGKGIKEHWARCSENGSIMLTQGFIGGGGHNRITTLGREGSDYTAAVIAYSIDAEAVTIWKDVPGVLNADPKYFNHPELLPNISYREAIELSFYGASVIHPKTIKPLQNKNIPLYVRSFLDPRSDGTVINGNTSSDNLLPSYIFKDRQILISISSRDFSFMQENNISEVYSLFAKHKVRVNTVQNSAISLSVSATYDEYHVPGLIEALKQDYEVRYNEGLELLTIRHYNEQVAKELVKEREVLLEQKTRSTLRILMRGQTRQ